MEIKGIRKTFLVLIMGIALTSSLAWSSGEPVLPKLVTVIPGNTFIPPGFDDNDNAQIVVAGALINTCWKIGPSSAKVDTANFRIYVTQQAYVYESSWCLQVMVPYTERIDLGVLPHGNYQVMNLDSQGVPKAAGTLPIVVAKTDQPDDFMYAPVQEVNLDWAQDGSTPTLILKGNFNSDCLDFQEVKVMYRAQNVIEVLPIVKVLQNTCNPTSKPFEAKVGIHSPWKGKTLIHIRTLNGHSINQVYSF